MTLSSQSIRKLFRDHFSNDKGLHVASGDATSDECKALVAEIRRRFAGEEWQDASPYHRSRNEDEARHLASFSLKDMESFYSGATFHFEIDEHDRLRIRSTRTTNNYTKVTLVASITSLDQIDSFVLDCRRRVERAKALEARREKVRGFKHTAMKAKIKKMAVEEDFHMAVDFTQQRAKLWVRLPEKNKFLQVQFSLKQFQEMLPRLPDLIRTLMACYDEGITFQVTGRQGMPWGIKWIR